MSELTSQPAPEIPKHWKIPNNIGIQETGVTTNLIVDPAHNFLSQLCDVRFGNIARAFRRECLFSPNGEVRALMIDRTGGLRNSREQDVTLFPGNFSVNYSLYSFPGLGRYGTGLEVSFSNINKKGFRMSESGKINTGEYIARVHYQSSDSDDLWVSQVEFSGDLQGGGEDVPFGPPAHIYYNENNKPTSQTEQTMIGDGWRKGANPNEYLYSNPKKGESFKFNFTVDIQNNKIVAVYADLQSGRRNNLGFPLKRNVSEVTDILDKKLPYEVKKRFGAETLEIPWLAVRNVVGISLSPPDREPL